MLSPSKHRQAKGKCPAGYLREAGRLHWWGYLREADRLHWRGYLWEADRLHWRGYLRVRKDAGLCKLGVLIAYIGGVICG